MRAEIAAEDAAVGVAAATAVVVVISSLQNANTVCKSNAHHFCSYTDRY